MEADSRLWKLQGRERGWGKQRARRRSRSPEERFFQEVRGTALCLVDDRMHGQNPPLYHHLIERQRIATDERELASEREMPQRFKHGGTSRCDARHSNCSQRRPILADRLLHQVLLGKVRFLRFSP